MPRKTPADSRQRRIRPPASMRPRPDAAENTLSATQDQSTIGVLQ